MRAQERPATLILTLTSGLRITRARQVYNREAETGSWNFVVPLRTIRMRKMCQSKQFLTWAWDTGCRLLSHGRFIKIKAFIQASVTYSGSDFRRKKLKTQRQSKMCFFFFTRTWGWNMYKFVFVWIVNVKHLWLRRTSRTKISSETLTWHFRVNSYHTSAKVQSISYESSFMMIRFQRNGRNPELITFFLSPRVIAWLNEVATATHNNTSWHFGKKKYPRIISSELNLEWKHLFQAFLTWFRRKHDFGGVEKGTKEKTEQTAYMYIKTKRELFGVRHWSET